MPRGKHLVSSSCHSFVVFCHTLAVMANVDIRKLRARRVQQPLNPERLVNLPLEVLTEVLKPLDWRDVLHLRQTCKCLSQVTRVKSIWMGLFNASNAAHSWSPLLLERPMDFYSSKELEYLVMRRESEEIKCKTQNTLSPALTRRLPIDNSGIGTLTLINGGRWLLTVSFCGSVSYYDLDTKNPVKMLLIPKIREQDHSGSFNAVAMAVDMDDSAVLTFNLALYLERVGDRYLSTETQVVQVWRVTLQLDEENHGTSLSATRLSSFPRENCGSLRLISLLGRYIAFGVGRAENERLVPPYIAIVDWAKANIQSQSYRYAGLARKLSYPRKVIPLHSEPSCMRLLPGDKICVTSRGRPWIKFSFYDISARKATIDVPPIDVPTWPLNSQPLLPMWELDLHSSPAENVSQLYCCSNMNTLRLVFNTHEAVHGIIIPGNGDFPKIIKLMDFKSKLREGLCPLSLGYNSAIANDGTSPVRMLYYSWPDDSGSPIGPSNSLTIRFGKKCWKEGESPAFDEGSGRAAVESFRGRNEILVYDLSDFKKCI